MCGSVNGGGSAPISAAVASPIPAAVATAPGGAAPAGVIGANPTQFAGATSLPLPLSLEEQIRQAQQQLAARQGEAAGGAIAVPGSSETTAFAKANAIDGRAVLTPVTDGASAIANLRKVVVARSERVEAMRVALAADGQRDPLGRTSPADQLQLRLDGETVASAQAFLAKLEPLVQTIDAAEAKLLEQVIQRANDAGGLFPVDVARTVIQIEGSAIGMPASYLASANRGQDLAATVRARVVSESNRLAGSPMGPVTAQPDQRQLQAYRDLNAQSTQLSTALAANFEQARTNPAAAQAKLDAALQTTDVATVIRALA